MDNQDDETLATRLAAHLDQADFVPNGDVPPELAAFLQLLVRLRSIVAEPPPGFPERLVLALAESGAELPASSKQRSRYRWDDSLIESNGPSDDAPIENQLGTSPHLPELFADEGAAVEEKSRADGTSAGDKTSFRAICER